MFAPTRLTAANVIYVYDSLNRLIKTDYDNGLVINYAYDAAGNRLSQIITSIAPTITMQPQTQATDFTGTVTFTVAANGTGPFAYQWKFNGINLVNGANVFGANTATLTLANVGAAQAGSYTATVTNADTSVTSAAASLTVTNPPDTDDDTLPNLLERALGLNPNAPSVVATAVVSKSGDFLKIKFNRNLAATDIGYFVQASNDLGSWFTIASLPVGSTNWITEGAATAVDNGGTVTVTDGVAFGSKPVRMLRLQVTSLSAADGGTASTAPAGCQTLTLKGLTDTSISLPVHRPAVFAGAVESVNAANQLRFAGIPFIVSQFAPQSLSQLTPPDEIEDAAYKGNSYYLLVKSGSLRGQWFQIGANTASSLTLVTDGATVTGAGKLDAGTRVEVLPFWRLPRIFPNLADADASNDEIKKTAFPSPANATVIYLRDPNAVGLNHAVAQGFFFYSGAANGGPGWRRQGFLFSAMKNDEPIPPDAVFVVRHNVAGDTKWSLSGAVAMTPAHLDSGTLAGNTRQDVHLPIPSLATVNIGGIDYINLTLADSRLLESGAIVGNVFPAPKDVLYAVDNDSTGFNKAVAQGYYFYSGTVGGGPGWRRQGANFSQKFDNEFIFKLGQTIVIRKAETPLPEEIIWDYQPPYVPVPIP